MPRELLLYVKKNPSEFYLYEDSQGVLDQEQSLFSQGLKSNDQLIGCFRFEFLVVVYQMEKLPKKHITIIDKIFKVTRKYKINVKLTILLYITEHYKVYF